MHTLSSNELNQVSGGLNLGPLGDPEVDFVDYMKKCRAYGFTDILNVRGYVPNAQGNVVTEDIGMQKIYEKWCASEKIDAKTTAINNHWTWND